MRLLLRLSSFLLLPGAVLGTVPSTIAPSHSHDIWDIARGFPGGYVYSITQTGDGYLWIGTSKGLIRYDGLSFVNVQGDSTETRFPVLGLVTDSSGQLWATDDHTHLFRYRAGSLNGLPDNGKHQYRVASLNKTRDGWLLFASELQGLIEYENGEARLLVEPGKLPSRPTAAAETADGTIWIGTREAGVFRLAGIRSAPEVQRVTGPLNVRVNCLLPIGDSTLLIGTDKGLLSLHHGNLIRETLPEVGNSKILALTKGQKGDLWIGTNGYVFKAHAKDIDTEGRINALDHLAVRGTVTALFEDRDGNLWIGEQQTIERHRDGAFTTYPSTAGLPCRNCGAIYVDHQERVWFAPWDGGLFRLSHGRIEPIELAGLKRDTVYSLAGAGDEIWVARKYGGLTRFRLQGDGLEASTYTRQNGLAEDAVYSIYRESDGTLWAGTLNQGLSRFRGGQWHTFTTKDGLPSNTISAIAGNSARKIFVGTPNGLAELNNDHWTAYTARDGLPPGTVESLFLDDADNLWIGTSKGISFLRSGEVHVPLGAPNALYGDILGLVESNGWLWITTQDRVLRVRRAALLKQEFAEGDYREFGVTEGLPSAAGVKRNRSVVLDDRGRIWFSLEQGISLLQPSAFDGPNFPVTIRFDGTLVDGSVIAPASHIHIPPGRHRLTFRYVGVNVSNPEAVRYRYRLDGVDSAWSEPTALREIDYTNLPPGTFRFHVTARNNSGVWNEQGAVLDFTIPPAYYQTNWFRSLCAAALIGLLWATYRLRLKQLQRQERKLRDVIQTIPTFAWTALPDGSVDFANRHWEEYTGLSPEQTVGSGWEAAAHPNDLGRHMEKWRASVTSGQPFENEVRFRQAAHGQYRWFLVRAVPLRDNRGKIIKWYGTATDIEDRNRSESYLAQAQQLAHIGSWAWEIPSRNALYISEEWYRIYGFDPKEGMPTWEQRLQRVHPKDRALWQATIDRAIAEKSDYNVEFRILPPHSTVKYIHSVGQPVLNSSGELLEFVGVAMDVTEGKHVEESLRSSEAYLVEAQSLTHTGSCAIDGASHETVYWSDEMFRLFGFDPQQGPPMFDQWLQRIHPEDREKLKLANERTLLNKVSCDVEFRVVKPDGKVKHIHGIGHPVLSPTGELVQVVGTMVDITERKRAEEARDRLRQLEADLAHISRVNTMGELTASLAHEIKQPIGAAVTNAEAGLRLLDRDQPDLPEAREAVLETVRDARRAADIIDRVRLLYQKGSPQLDIVDVNEVIRDMVIVLHNEANRHSVKMHTDLAEELPKVMADRVQLQQALMNLMLNGIEAMRDTSGELSIKSQLADDDQLVISIADTGVGLPTETMDKIFDAFFTTKSQGTGLGLAITRSIIESHGGRIWATPNAGRGATFYFTLPNRIAVAA
jgi:PAS domain S-box-containing protein